MFVDYHVHTPLCGHAHGLPREYIQTAIAQGLSEIGFSDHNPMPTQFDKWRMAPEQFDEYIAMVEGAQREFPNYPIRLGMECDFLPGYEEHIRSLSKRASFDYLIGSVHYIMSPWDKVTPIKIEDWKTHSPVEAWKYYFEALAQSAQSGLYDFLAHPDLIKNNLSRPEGDLKPYFSDALDAIKDCDLAIEINTSGLRKKVAEQYPSLSIIEEAAKREIPLLINSDAHNPADVGSFFSEARKMAWEAGYRQLCRFEKRERIQIPLVF